MKIFGGCLLIFLALLACLQPGQAEGLDVSVNTGATIVVGPSRTLDTSGGPLYHTQMPFNLSIGYSFGSFRVAVEGLASFPFFQYGVSLIGNGTFASNTILRGYALLGVGYGSTWFFENTGNEDGDIEGNGWLQLQAGIGIGFPITDWLELGTETRFRIGVPKFPEIVALTQDVFVMFKF